MLLLGWIGAFPRLALATQSVTLAWNPSPDTNVIGYKIYYGVASRTYTNVVDAGNVTNATISGLVEGVTYYFAATAYNRLGMESAFSNEAVYTVPLPANQPPTLSPIANLTINENAGPQTVALSGISSGASNQIQTLTVTAVSSNPGLIPNPTLSYTNPNSTGTLTLAPVAYASGTALITVTVNNGGASNNVVSRTFTVTVNPVNYPPTLNPIGNLAIAENSGLQTVTLSGISSGAPNQFQTLTVSAVSSNPALIPNPTLNYASPNSTGSLSFAPVSGAFGSATVTVSVNNGGASNNIVRRTFTVTVDSPPTISAIPNQIIPTNTVTAPISFTIGDYETPASNLTPSALSSAPALLPASNIVFGGSNGNRTVRLAPLAGQSGSAIITITVSDGVATASTTFRLMVLAPPPPVFGIRVTGAGP